MKKYINKFFGLKSAAYLLPFFQSARERTAKEITESYACFNAIHQVLGISTQQENVACIVVGDGSYPRTGALISHLTKWNVISVDPEFKMDEIRSIFEERSNGPCPIQRLKLNKCLAKHLTVEGGQKDLVLVLPHSHCPMDEAISCMRNYKSLSIVNMPCCTPVPEKYLAYKYVKENNLTIYADHDCWSPKRVVYTWKNLEIK